MASAEVFGSGVVPQKADSRRVLLAKYLNAKGGVALKRDTVRTLEYKALGVLDGNLPAAPAAPSLFSYSPNGGTATFTWSEAVSPDLDFVVYCGTTLGGPYPNSRRFPAESRTGVISGFDVLTAYFAVCVARNSAASVSANSNQIQLYGPP